MSRVAGEMLRGIDRAPTEAWLLANVPGAIAPFRWELIAAGGSNLTYRLEDARNVLRVLRRPPAGSALATAHDMSREARVMRALGSRETGVPVPRVIADCRDAAVTGAPFYVMEFVDGLIIRSAADAALLDAASARRATQSLVATQAALHTLDPAAVGLADLGRHGGYVARQLARWRKQVESAAVRELPLLGRIHEALSANLPAEAAPPALVHGDYRLDNVVLGEDRCLRAVLDWELCTIGDPIADFFWSLLYWAEPGDELAVLPDPPTRQPQFPRRAELEAHYAELTGFALHARGFYLAFSWWKQACIVEGVHARLLQGAGGGMRGASPERAAALVDRYLAKAAALAL